MPFPRPPLLPDFGRQKSLEEFSIQNSAEPEYTENWPENHLQFTGLQEESWLEEAPGGL